MGLDLQDCRCTHTNQLLDLSHRIKTQLRVGIHKNCVQYRLTDGLWSIVRASAALMRKALWGRHRSVLKPGIAPFLRTSSFCGTSTTSSGKTPPYTGFLFARAFTLNVQFLSVSILRYSRIVSIENVHDCVSMILPWIIIKRKPTKIMAI